MVVHGGVEGRCVGEEGLLSRLVADQVTEGEKGREPRLTEVGLRPGIGRSCRGCMREGKRC